MRFFIAIGLFFSTMIASAQPNFLPVTEDMSAFTRSMDLLLAREEMKDSLTLSLFSKALKGGATPSSVDKKVALLTDAKSLQDCEITHTETQSPDGSETNAFFEYKGPDCPIKITGKFHIIKGQMGLDGQASIVCEILSPELKAEFDTEKVEIPLVVKTTVTPIEQGVELDVQMDIAGKALSESLGPVDWISTTHIKTAFSMAGIFNKIVGNETYTSGEQKIVFTTVLETNNSETTETYSIDGVVVSKEEFDKRHGSVEMPGFETKPKPLPTSHLCEVRTYDTAQHSLESIRKSIKENSIGSVAVAEILAPIFLTQTGQETRPAFLGLMLSVETSLDAVRFSFEKPTVTNGQPNEVLGKLTYVLGDKAELTKVVANRVVRVTCSPK